MLGAVGTAVRHLAYPGDPRTSERCPRGFNAFRGRKLTARKYGACVTRFQSTTLLTCLYASHALGSFSVNLARLFLPLEFYMSGCPEVRLVSPRILAYQEHKLSWRADLGHAGPKVLPGPAARSKQLEVSV